MDAGQFHATHTAPPTGLATYPTAGATTPGPRLDPYLPVQVLEEWGAWAHVMCSNGWSAWVDGRQLVPITAPGVAAPPPTPAAPPPTPTAPPPTPATPPPAVAMPTVNPAPTGVAGLAPVAAPVPVPPPAVTAAGPSPGVRPPAAAGAAGPWITPSAATWPTLAGAALVVVGALLPWVDVRGSTRNSFDVPFMFLFDKTATGGLKLGIPLLVLAALAVVLRHLRSAVALARIPAALVLPASILYIVQMNALVSGSELGLFDVLGIGVWPALIGGALMSWGGRTR